ncbi:MAG: hypothetical protein HC888_11745 [Candidatus Competibacteraceae bacterium]|nr:hypothetical protein [Candidatus Competibacteraceae bacterium]
MLDIDGNGRADALTDGLILLSYLFDDTGTTLGSSLERILGEGATRTTVAELVNFMEMHLPDIGAAGARSGAATVPDWVYEPTETTLSPTDPDYLLAA